MILGLGTDIVEISRIKRAILKNEKFLKRIYSESEIEYSLAKKNPYPSLAVRFAAKEAFSKALGTGFRSLKIKEIEVRLDRKGRPEIYYSQAIGEILREKKMKNIQVSLSHSKEYALAVVVIEGAG